MKTLLNYLSKFVEWIGRGDPFIGTLIFIALVVVFVVFSFVAFVLMR